MPDQVTKTLTPVPATKQFDESDILVYLSKDVETLSTLGFGLQSLNENPSEFLREFVHDGAIMALKYICQQNISRWDSTITRASKQRKYSKFTRDVIPVELCKRAEFRKQFDIVQASIKLKNQLK